MRVSVVVPVFNTGRFVEQSVRSALEQPQTFEVLVVDDGSTDETRPLCDALAREDTRVRVLEHPGRVNRGVGASRNLAITEARGDFVAFLDADDFFLPGRFDAAERAFEDASVDGVYDAVGNVYEDPSLRQWWLNEYSPDEVTTLNRVVAPEDLFEVLLRGSDGYFCTDGIVVRREFFARCGLFVPGLHRYSDTLLWLQMAGTGNLVGGSLVEPVAMRRLHGQNSIILIDDARVRVQLWLVLHHWMRGRGMPLSAYRALARRYFRDWREAHVEEGSKWQRSRPAIAAFLLGTAVRHPRLAASRSYLGVAAAAVRR